MNQASKDKTTVLISSAGRRVEFINCFFESAQDLGCDLKVVATDAAPAWSSACQRADQSYTVPRCDNAGFIPAMLEICEREGVALLVPTIDHELALYAEARPAFEKIGTTISVSDPATIALARNKLESNRFFRDIGLQKPRCALLRDVLAEPAAWKFPLIAKPIDGSSSIGLRLVPSLEALRALAVDPTRYVVQDHLRGLEYTVNMFFDPHGLRSAVQHQRVEMRAGEVSKGITTRLPALTTAAEKLGQALAGKAFGALNFQAIVTEDRTPHLLEMNARFSGGYPLAHRAGAPFTRWLLESAVGREISAHNDWQTGITMLRYDAAIFLSTPNQG